MAVYNLAGRKVRTLHSGAVIGGTNELVWEGLDDSGCRVASGVYFITLESPGEMISRKAVLLR